MKQKRGPPWDGMDSKGKPQSLKPVANKDMKDKAAEIMVFLEKTEPIQSFDFLDEEMICSVCWREGCEIGPMVIRKGSGH